MNGRMSISEAAEKLEEKAVEPEPAEEPGEFDGSAEKDEPMSDEQVNSYAPAASSCSSISPAVAKKIDDDNSVIAQCEQNTTKALFSFISDRQDITIEALAAELLSEIRGNKIPNVKYDIY